MKLLKMDEHSDEEKVDIPILKTDLVAFDENMSCVKEKFIAEMKKMDEEMKKFSSDLQCVYKETMSMQEEIASKTYDQESSEGCSTYESLAKSPLVECKGDKKTLRLQFDVSQFDPDEVKVKVQNETLVISASHEEKCENNSVLRQYYREFKFPRGVDPCAVQSTLSKDGVLTVQAPLPQPNDGCGKCSS